MPDATDAFGFENAVIFSIELKEAVRADGRLHGPSTFAVLCSMVREGLSYEEIRWIDESFAAVVAVKGLENL